VTTARSFVREPTQVVVLVVLPVVVVEGYGIAMESFPEFPFLETLPATMGRLNGAVYAAAFVAAIVGLFQVISARRADERLLLCGYERTTLFGTRLAMVAGVSLLVSAVALAALARSVTPGALVVAYLALVAAALVYGLIGMLVGAVLPRALEGSLVLVFLIDADDFLSSGMLDIDSTLLEVFPLYHPHALFRGAVLESESVAAGDALSTAVYLAVLLVVAALAYARLTGNGGVLRG
jgi:hypothetical protein